MAALCCPRCGLDYALPVEPVFTLATSAVMLGMPIDSLKRWLGKHKHDYGIHQPQYMGPWGRRRRVLLASEIRYIREGTVTPHRTYRSSRSEAARAAQQVLG